MIQHQTSVTVKKPVAQGFQFIAVGYVKNHPRWDRLCVETVQSTPGPIGLGAEGREVRRDGGRRATYTWRVSEYEPNRKISFETSSGPARYRGSYAFEPAGSDTKVTFSGQIQMGGMMRLFEGMMGSSFRKEMDRAAAEMKRLAEE